MLLGDGRRGESSFDGSLNETKKKISRVERGRENVQIGLRRDFVRLEFFGEGFDRFVDEFEEKFFDFASKEFEEFLVVNTNQSDQNGDEFIFVEMLRKNHRRVQLSFVELKIIVQTLLEFVSDEINDQKVQFGQLLIVESQGEKIVQLRRENFFRHVDQIESGEIIVRGQQSSNL